MKSSQVGFTRKIDLDLSAQESNNVHATHCLMILYMKKSDRNLANSNKIMGKIQYGQTDCGMTKIKPLLVVTSFKQSPAI